MLVDFCDKGNDFDGNVRGSVLPQLFLRLFVAGWLYNSSLLFGGATASFSLLARSRIQCIVFERSPADAERHERKEKTIRTK